MGPCQESFNRVDKRESEGSKGVQGRLPRNAPLWHGDYFKPKTIEAQWTQEECFTSILTVKKNSDRELVPGRELLPEITLHQKGLSAWQGKHPFTKHLLFPSSCELTSSPFVVSDSYPFLLSSGWRRRSLPRMECLTVKESHIFGVPVRTKLNIFFSCC